MGSYIFPSPQLMFLQWADTSPAPSGVVSSTARAHESHLLVLQSVSSLATLESNKCTTMGSVMPRLFR